MICSIIQALNITTHVLRHGGNFVCKVMCVLSILIQLYYYRKQGALLLSTYLTAFKCKYFYVCLTYYVTRAKLACVMGQTGHS